MSRRCNEIQGRCCMMKSAARTKVPRGCWRTLIHAMLGGSCSGEVQEGGPGMLPLQRLRHGALLSIGISLVGVPPASAQGFFDSLFGRPSPPPAAAPAYSPGPAPAPCGGSSLTSAASNPAAPMSGFRGAAFCVRLCDGRFFPMQPHANVTPVALCQALCPASDTRVFHGSDIAQATSADGGRYSGLK